MEWLALFKIILQEWGPTAISTVLVFVVVHLITRINNNSKNDAQRDTELRTDIAKRDKELRDDIHKTLNNFGERLSRVEHDYVKNEMFYRELSGWRTEINRLHDFINNQFANLIQIFK